MIVPENYTSAALDGARISAATAQFILEIDAEIPESRKQFIREAIETAREYLDLARANLPVITTSVHIVSGGR